MTKDNAKDLLFLADFLNKLPEQQFDIGFYIYIGEAECGTVGCVAGWATQIPQFQAGGLMSVGMGDIAYRQPDGEIYHGAWGAGLFFGLNREERTSLFYRRGYEMLNPGPKDASAKIREIVSRHYPEFVFKPS